MDRQRGTAVVDVVVVIALLGALGWAGKAFLGSGKKDAKESVAATEQLVDTVEDKEAQVAASLVSIGAANVEAPETPSKAFIEREVPAALSLLPEPPESALKAAETRRMAVMEGNLREANRLYAQLKDENIELQQRYENAVKRRIDADRQLVAAANERMSDQLRNMGVLAVAGLLLYGWVTRARQSVPLAVVGQTLAHARQPESMVRELDTVLSPSQQRVVKKASKAHTPDD